MMGKVLLCADTDSLMNPALLGIDRLGFDGLDWLISASDASLARRLAVEQDDIEMAWIAGSDEVCGVNLAAALRKDKPELPIFLISFEASGSELSRASQAGVTATLKLAGFVGCFESELKRRQKSSNVEDAPLHGQKDPERESLGKEACHEGGSNTFVISLFSGSGGVGKSTATTVAAFLAARAGFKVLMVDCDLQFGDLHQMAPNSPKVSMDDAVSDAGSITALAANASDVPHLISAPVRLERSETLHSHIAPLLESCSGLYDMIFVNTGSSWTDCHAQLLELSSCSVFMIDQRASSIRACQHALELCSRMGIATGSFAYALNRCERGALFSPIDIANAMQGAHVYEIREGGTEVEELLGAGRGMELANSKNAMCSSIAEMMSDILPSVLTGKAGSSSRGKSVAGNRPSSSTRQKSRRRGISRKSDRRIGEAAHAIAQASPLEDRTASR